MADEVKSKPEGVRVDLTGQVPWSPELPEGSVGPSRFNSPGAGRQSRVSPGASRHSQERWPRSERQEEPPKDSPRMSANSADVARVIEEIEAKYPQDSCPGE